MRWQSRAQQALTFLTSHAHNDSKTFLRRNGVEQALENLSALHLHLDDLALRSDTLRIEQSSHRKSIKRTTRFISIHSVRSNITGGVCTGVSRPCWSADEALTEETAGADGAEEAPSRFALALGLLRWQVRQGLASRRKTHLAAAGDELPELPPFEASAFADSPGDDLTSRESALKNSPFFLPPLPAE